uniref:Putative zn finger n=1 Tax=Anopheles triannulatus TaxID=58253 RepID=A0A2M4AW60_9DIPT
MEVLGEISNFCRFCLSQDSENLMQLSSAIEGLSFSVQDIQQTTGISILESETGYLAVCIKCCSRVELAVDFRRSCVDGNVKFFELFGHIIDKLRSSEFGEYLTDDPLKIGLVLHDEPTDGNASETYDGPALPLEDSDEQTTNGQEDFDDERSSSEDLSQVSTTTLRPNKKTKYWNMTVSASNQRMAKSKEQIEESKEDLAIKPNNPKKQKKTVKPRKQLCGICGALVVNMVDHIRSHTKQNLLKCPHCPLQMAYNANLLRHVHTVHKKTVIKTCEPCGKGFITYDSYKTHMRTYHNIGAQYQCEICLKTFKHPSNRREHIKRIHIAEWKFECQICQKKFKDAGVLREHARVHSSDAPYACSHCPKRFKSSSAKRTHEITHSGIRFACSFCSKVYRYKTLLNMHYRKCHPAEWNGDSTQQAVPNGN